MSRQYYNLPSLNALSTFEAVARHQSLTLSAREFGVTPGAVSRQIKSLESELGITLLIRQHKKISCNKQGRSLYDSLRIAFSGISKTVNEFDAKKDNLTFALGSTTAFSSLWLMPRLSRFWREYPQIHIHHILSDDISDPAIDGIDISIRYGLKNHATQLSRYLFNDHIYPVCSPKLAKAYKHIKQPSQLIGLPLLQLHHENRSWANWQSWLSNFKIKEPLADVNSFNNYIIALQAATESQGILLGLDKLVQPLINEGKLVKLLDMSTESPGAYYLYESKTANMAVRLFPDWILQPQNLE